MLFKCGANHPPQVKSRQVSTLTFSRRLESCMTYFSHPLTRREFLSDAISPGRPTHSIARRLLDDAHTQYSEMKPSALAKPCDRNPTSCDPTQYDAPPPMRTPPNRPPYPCLTCPPARHSAHRPNLHPRCEGSKCPSRVLSRYAGVARCVDELYLRRALRSAVQS